MKQLIYRNEIIGKTISDIKCKNYSFLTIIFNDNTYAIAENMRDGCFVFVNFVEKKLEDCVKLDLGIIDKKELIKNKITEKSKIINDYKKEIKKQEDKLLELQNKLIKT